MRQTEHINAAVGRSRVVRRRIIVIVLAVPLIAATASVSSVASAENSGSIEFLAPDMKKPIGSIALEQAG